MSNYCILKTTSFSYSTLQCAEREKQRPNHEGLRNSIDIQGLCKKTRNPAPSAKTSGRPTWNSTTTACSEAAWGITTAPGPRCGSTAVRTYQKYRLCHGNRLVVKNGSPRRTETWRAEQEAELRHQKDPSEEKDRSQVSWVQGSNRPFIHSLTHSVNKHVCKVYTCT